MGFHGERAAAGLGPSGFTVVLWLWKKGLPWKFVFVLCCSVKLVFFFNSLCVWIVWQWHQSSCFAHLPQSYVTWHWQIVFICVWSVVEAGLFLHVQWYRLVKACSPYSLVDNTCAGITYWCLFCWSLLHSTILCSQADCLRSCRM